jgi:1,4-alpha-glucan branching enzyme
MPATQRPALDEAIAALIRGTHRDPFAVLGPHADESGAAIVRAFQPAARSIELHLVSTRTLVPMTKRDPAGLFEVRIERVPLEPDATDQVTADSVVSGFSRTEIAPDYRLRITYASGQVIEIDDPYRYGRVLTDFDLHLLHEGTHHRMFEKLGAHRIAQGTTTGVHFAVWAPNAERVSVIGDFNGWDVTPDALLMAGGIWRFNSLICRRRA